MKVNFAIITVFLVGLTAASPVAAPAPDSVGDLEIRGECHRKDFHCKNWDWGHCKCLDKKNCDFKDPSCKNWDWKHCKCDDKCKKDPSLTSFFRDNPTSKEYTPVILDIM
ncbi:hypothetical protein ASPWEDRAFT_25437 [Aspergillus wentii DTO 134E9]|uniref:Extracellular membrane protein CFEM domain-containing protein n=1 Tax=Aspergillus wentii DTO 134E9 TaxID=1073089 RepID=A0A1L9RXH2_ASPWE|nr:uncharacterized protein ASPWEDRAFT_25437 [Aspergillus wentii DTO 134E9]OJJ39622.1 hypothetical protein ASPWEDRAFT_25437 [Aspergillus wentii DTO 134E9]